MQDKNSDDRVLLTLEHSLAAIDDSLERAGFDSCLVDRDWMRRQSSEEEWQDFLKYKREYAREVLASESPAKIKHANPDEYRWRSKMIRDRVLERFRQFGDVHALFQDSSKRHLVEMTVPEQRLSQILERASPAAVEECEARHREFDRRRLKELERADSDDTVRRSVEQLEANVDASPCVFFRLLLARATRQICSVNPNSLRFLSDADADQGCVELEVSVHPKNASSTGAIYLSTFHRSRPTAIHARRRLPIERLLPSEFRCYSRFTSQRELIVCFAAWLHVGIHIAKTLIEGGWKPRMD